MIVGDARVECRQILNTGADDLRYSCLRLTKFIVCRGDMVVNTLDVFGYGEAVSKCCYILLKGALQSHHRFETEQFPWLFQAAVHSRRHTNITEFGDLLFYVSFVLRNKIGK